MPTAEKIETVSVLSQKMAQADAIFLTDFTGIDVASVTRLRRSLRQAGVDYCVVKNRLAKRAVIEAGLEPLARFLQGPTAMAFVKTDPISPAKILQKFIDDGGRLAIKTGLVNGQVVTAESVRQLALLPSRDDLLARVVGSFQAPLYRLAGVLNGLLREFVGVVSAIRDQKEGRGAVAAE